MKKILTLALVGAMLTATGITAFAVDYPGGTQDTEITTNIAPTFTVTIPADTTVPFNALSTEFGSVTLESARLAPNKAVQVTVIAEKDILGIHCVAGQTWAQAIVGTDFRIEYGKYVGKDVYDSVDEEWNVRRIYDFNINWFVNPNTVIDLTHEYSL